MKEKIKEQKSSKSLATKFETRVQDFFKKLGFKNVRGGDSFKIGGSQIDACGGFGEYLLVVECFMATKRTRKSLRSKIKEFRGVFESTKRGVKNDKIYENKKRIENIYNKYKKIIFILATKNITISNVDKNFASEKPKIIIWDENFVNYYEKLYSLIGEYARFNLVGELNIKPRVNEMIKIPALQTKINSYMIYSFFIEPKKLLECTYVARREIGREKYYQRILKKDRIKNIVKFLDKGGTFPNNIIIALNEKPNFTKFEEVKDEWSNWPNWLNFGILEFPKNYRSCWIIDGQHRLYSFAKSKKETPIDVVAFEDIKPEEQAQFFIEINKEQKPVDSDLIWDLQGEMRPETEGGIISNIVKNLNAKSSLLNKIYIPLKGPRKEGMFKLSGLCISIQKRKLSEKITEKMRGSSKNPLYDRKPSNVVKKVSNSLSLFFATLDEIFDHKIKEKFIFTNGGLSVFIILFERIVSRLSKLPRKEDFEKYTKPLIDYLEKEYDTEEKLKRLRLNCASEGGKNEVSSEFIRYIRDIINDSRFGEDIIVSPFGEEMKITERNLGKLIQVLLEKENKNWRKDRIPIEILKKAEDRFKKKSISDNRQKIHEFFTLGECGIIIKRKDNWKIFKKVFISTEEGFENENEFLGAFNRINKVRGAIIHGEKIIFKKLDQDLLKIYLDKIKNCIRKRLV